MRALEEWEAAGRRMTLGGRDVFVVDRAAERERGVPALILHGFPTCSFDWRHVLPALVPDRRVVAIDFLGFGLSEKPFDLGYSLFAQADLVEEAARALGLEEVALLTHDMGDSVGGELLARDLERTLPFRVSRRVIANGSIYMDLVQLSPGQLMLLAMPDEALPQDAAIGPEMFKPALGATFSANHPAREDELDAQWTLIARGDGHRLGPRLIRYVEERRVHEPRWTGAIESHPSPLAIVWGDLDPIAVWPMAERLHARVPGSTLARLEGVGHYPMIETPDRFAEAMLAGLAEA